MGFGVNPLFLEGLLLVYTYIDPINQCGLHRNCTDVTYFMQVLILSSCVVTFGQEGIYIWKSVKQSDITKVQYK